MRKGNGEAFTKWAGKMLNRLPHKFMRECYDKEMTLGEAVKEYERRHEGSN
jgi:hypothetical protein